MILILYRGGFGCGYHDPERVHVPRLHPLQPPHPSGQGKLPVICSVADPDNFAQDPDPA